ncbi:Cyclic nucleotide-gated potassium channel [bacterium HR40]|nr:Cyclic nucleotide-gated potassium channel [bacterium HR40]
MTIHKDVEALRRIPLFARIDPARLKLLAFTSDRLHFEPGERLCSEGEPGDAAFIILEGTARVLVRTPEGELEVARLGEHAIVGEIAILCNVPRTATVEAATPVTVLRISKDGFLHLVSQFPQIAVEMMSELARRLHRTTQQLKEVTSRLQKLEEARH